jgi:hypothetical protein
MDAKVKVRSKFSYRRLVKLGVKVIYNYLKKAPYAVDIYKIINKLYRSSMVKAHFRTNQPFSEPII